MGGNPAPRNALSRGSGGGAGSRARNFNLSRAGGGSRQGAGSRAGSGARGPGSSSVGGNTLGLRFN